MTDTFAKTPWGRVKYRSAEGPIDRRSNGCTVDGNCIIDNREQPRS